MNESCRSCSTVKYIPRSITPSLPILHVLTRRRPYAKAAHARQRLAVLGAAHSQLSADPSLSSASNDGLVANHQDGYQAGLVRSSKLKFNDPVELPLRRRAYVKWKDAGGPRQVLIIKKPGNPAASQRLWEIAAWLHQHGVQVVVEKAVQSKEFPNLPAYDPQLHKIDLAITLGGDGTVLHLAQLFPPDEPLPPVVSFAMGTLGFLTPFDVNDFERCLTRVTNTRQSPLFCTLRARKAVEVHKDGQLLAVQNVLNEVVIDRGAFPGSVLLECFVDDQLITSIEADGLIIATPSGSTAYSMSAGGPMIAPSVPCTVLTPIAPLSLSFRPIIIPEASVVRITLPEYARSHARASFDGKHSMRLRKGTSLTINTALCPLPMINLGNLDADWYEGISKKLGWNKVIRDPPASPSQQDVATDFFQGMQHATTSNSTHQASSAGNGTNATPHSQSSAPYSAGCRSPQAPRVHESVVDFFEDFTQH